MECMRNPQHRRISSTCVYFMLYFIIGFSYYIRASQVVFYLKEIKDDHIPFYQGLLAVNSQVFGTFASLALGALCDKYGKARSWISLGNACGIVGVLIYSIPYSPLTMLAAEVVMGVFIGLFSVSTAELARMFKGRSVTRAFSVVNIGLTIGLVLGPMTNLILVDVNITYGWFYIHPTNAPGFVIAGLMMIVQVFLICGLYNSEDIATVDEASEETPMVKHDYNESTPNGHITNTSMTPPKAPLLAKLRLLLRNKDLVLVYWCTFLSTFVVIGFESILPLVSVEWLHFSSTRLSGAYMMGGGVFVAINVLLAIFAAKINDFYLTLTMVIIQIVVPVLMVCLNALQGHDGDGVMAMYYIWVILSSITWLVEDVLTRALSSELVPLEMQGFAEGCRTVPRGIGLVAAGFSTSLWFNYVNPFSAVVAVLIIVLIILLTVRRKQLANPIRMVIMSDRENGVISAHDNGACMNVTDVSA